MLLENNAYPGDTRVRREALALVEAGFEVTVIAPREGDQPSKDVVNGVHVYRYPAPFEHNSFLGFVWEFFYSTVAAFLVSFRVAFARGFDVIHAHNPPDTLFVIGLFYKIFGKRFVFDHHDLGPELYMARSDGQGNRVVYNALRLLEKWTFKTSNLVISTNESYKKIARTRGGVPENKIAIVRNGPPLKSLGSAEPIQELRASGKTIFGYAGAISVQDGLDYLIKALDHLRTDLRREDFLCIIMGDGDDLNRIRGLTRDAGLEEHVLFTGWLEREDLWRHLATLDIGVDPDPSNDFNDKCTMIKMTEYMAFSTCIVAFDLPEHRYTAGESAIYVPDNDPVKFASALHALMDDPAERKRLGRIGRERVEKEIAWEYSTPKLVEAYQRLLNLPIQQQAVNSRSDDMCVGQVDPVQEKA